LGARTREAWSQGSSEVAYTWQIFREREALPVEESINRFGSWEEASQAGMKELKKLSAD
jgi:hypothetical protein